MFSEYLDVVMNAIFLMQNQYVDDMIGLKKQAKAMLLICWELENLVLVKQLLNAFISHFSGVLLNQLTKHHVKKLHFSKTSNFWRFCRNADLYSSRPLQSTNIEAYKMSALGFSSISQNFWCWEINVKPPKMKQFYSKK